MLCGKVVVLIKGFFVDVFVFFEGLVDFGKFGFDLFGDMLVSVLINLF